MQYPPSYVYWCSTNLVYESTAPYTTLPRNAIPVGASARRRTHMHTHAHLHTSRHSHLHTNTYIHTPTYTHLYTYRHSHILTRTYTDTHAHLHTHTAASAGGGISAHIYAIRKQGPPIIKFGSNSQQLARYTPAACCNGRTCRV